LNGPYTNENTGAAEKQNFIKASGIPKTAPKSSKALRARQLLPQ
jgi:hypothetical protein